MTGNPRRAVHGILDHLGIELPATWRPAARQRRQADEVNADWIRRYRAARQRSSTQTAWTATQVAMSRSDGFRSYCRALAWRFVVGYGSHESQVRADSRADTFGGCPGSWFVAPRRI